MEFLQIAMTARALACAGVDIERAMERAGRAHRDQRWEGALRVRRVRLAALESRAPSALRRRAHRAGLGRVEAATRVESLARVELVRALLGSADHIEALGPHPMEQP